MQDQRTRLLSAQITCSVFVMRRRGKRSCLVRLTARTNAERELSERESREDAGQPMTYLHA